MNVIKIKKSECKIPLAHTLYTSRGLLIVDLQTKFGTITISPFYHPKQIADLSFEAFHYDEVYAPIISKKETLIRAALQPDANLTLAITPTREIIGLGILQYPAPDERWIRVGNQVMMEVSVIEVVRKWRSMGIGKEILRLVTDHPLKEERIFYMVGYSWTWDLNGVRIQKTDYRNMMINLFSQYGFQRFQTNEPNIMIHAENIFMARIGKNISEDVQKQFRKVRFNLDL